MLTLRAIERHSARLAMINPLCDAPLIFELASGTLTSIPEMKLPASNQNCRRAWCSRRRYRRRLVLADARDRFVNNPAHIQRISSYADIVKQ